MVNKYLDSHYIGECGCNIDINIEDPCSCIDIADQDACKCLDIELRENIINFSGGSDKHYVFKQNAPSEVWVINHNLNKFPSVSIVDSAGTQCQGEVKYIDVNTVKVFFSAAFSGKAYLN